MSLVLLDVRADVLLELLFQSPALLLMLLLL